MMIFLSCEPVRYRSADCTYPNVNISATLKFRVWRPQGVPSWCKRKVTSIRPCHHSIQYRGRARPPSRRVGQTNVDVPCAEYALTVHTHAPNRRIQGEVRGRGAATWRAPWRMLSESRGNETCRTALLPLSGLAAAVRATARRDADARATASPYASTAVTVTAWPCGRHSVDAPALAWPHASAPPHVSSRRAGLARLVAPIRGTSGPRICVSAARPQRTLRERAWPANRARRGRSSRRSGASVVVHARPMPPHEGSRRDTL